MISLYAEIQSLLVQTCLKGLVCLKLISVDLTRPRFSLIGATWCRDEKTLSILTAIPQMMLSNSDAGILLGMIGQIG